MRMMGPAAMLSVSHFCFCDVENKRCRLRAGKRYSDTIPDNLKKAGWSVGWVSAVDSRGRTIWIVDVHAYGRRFIVRADEMLTEFVELQRAIREFAVGLIA